MALATFKEFLVNQGAARKIESASTLITLTGFPIKEFSEWYKEIGICLQTEHNQRIIQEGVWDSALKGAGYGAVGGTFAGGPVGTALGGASGFLAGAAKDILGGGWNWYSKWRDPKGYYEKGFKKQKQYAAQALQNLKNFSQDMAKAGVAGADDKFMQLLDTIISTLQDTGTASPPSPSPSPPDNPSPSPTPPPPPPPSSDDDDGKGDDDGTVSSPEELSAKIEQIKGDSGFQQLLGDINSFSTRVALGGKTPDEAQALRQKYAQMGLAIGVEEEELAKAVLVYMDSYNTDYAKTLEGLKDALIIKTDDPEYKKLVAYANRLGYDAGVVLDKFQDLMLSNIINGEEIDQPEAARELAAWFKSAEEDSEGS